MRQPWALLLVTSLGACVDPFTGSKMELFLHAGVQIPSDQNPGNGKPPSDAHYEIYAVRGSGVFELAEFDIQPVILTSSRCFIELEDDRFPGLHSTHVEAKTIQVAQADGTVTSDEAGDIAVAKIRVGNMNLLESGLKVITTHEPGLTDAAVAALEQSVPDPSLIDDASNAQRLAACRAIFAEHPYYYVGNDKVLGIPKNGGYRGLVEGSDPRNSALVGGAAFDMPSPLDEFDAMRINWNFNNANDPRRASLSPSLIGWHYMAGVPVVRVRGVINVSMRHADFSQISGEAAIFPALGEDNVQF